MGGANLPETLTSESRGKSEMELERRDELQEARSTDGTQ